jgi:hypothetical protein
MFILELIGSLDLGKEVIYRGVNSLHLSAKLRPDCGVEGGGKVRDQSPSLGDLVGF